MQLLDLSLIGWLFSVGCGIALALGSLIMGWQYGKGGMRKSFLRWLLDDLTLIAIWLLGLAGGIGVLHGKAWSRPVLELFCWVLIILLLLSCWTRLREARSPWGMQTVSMALFVTPIVAVCIATIMTLRSDSAVRALSG